MNTFTTAYQNFLSDFGKGRTMVLSTSENDVVYSRMMSVVQIEGVAAIAIAFVPSKYLSIL